jgi:hypothetical protein
MKISPVTALAAILALVACHDVRGSGTPKTETRDVATFTEVDVSSGIDLELKVGPAGPVSVTADDNLLPNVGTDVDHGRLRVAMKGTSSTTTRVHVVASAPAITAAHASSGSSVAIAGLAGDAVVLEASSGATLKANGAAKSLTVSASSGATVDAAGVVAVAVTTNASAGATVTVDATEDVKGVASAGASVVVRGGPKGRAVVGSSGGSVKYE